MFVGVADFRNDNDIDFVGIDDEDIVIRSKEEIVHKNGPIEVNFKDFLFVERMGILVDNKITEKVANVVVVNYIHFHVFNFGMVTTSRIHAGLAILDIVTKV